MDFNQQDVLILNSLDQEVSVKAFGNYFTFKANQVKRMRPEIGTWIEQQKGYMGLVSIPEQFDEPEFKETEEGKAILESKKKEGLEKRIRFLQSQVNNLQLSLAYDLATADIKAPIETFATDGDLSAMEELLTLQRSQNDETKKKSESARIKLRQLASAQNAMVNKPRESKE